MNAKWVIEALESINGLNEEQKLAIYISIEYIRKNERAKASIRKSIDAGLHEVLQILEEGEEDGRN